VTKEQAIDNVHNGKPVECSADEYRMIRPALQDAAATWINQGQEMRAQIALSEVRRLDALHGAPSLFGRRSQAE
jgi:hypothetical protein